MWKNVILSFCQAQESSLSKDPWVFEGLAFNKKELLMTLQMPYASKLNWPLLWHLLECNKRLTLQSSIGPYFGMLEKPFSAPICLENCPPPWLQK
jgi:hypothetical protein